jgi:hypothetical protein
MDIIIAWLKNKSTTVINEITLKQIAGISRTVSTAL